MQLSDFNRFHWIVIGLLGGLVLAYMWTGTTDIDGIRASDQREFERDLLLKDDKTGLPFVSHIVVHPAEDSPTGKVNVVLYKKLARDKKGNVGLWLDKRLVAKIPYKPAIAGRVSDDPNMTITTYLQTLSQQEGGKFSFHYGWWLEPNKAMALGATGGLLLVGGLWPTSLGLMAGAGFGPKPRETQKKRIDWRSFVRRSPSGDRSSSIGGPGKTFAAPAAVDDVTRAYEKKLAPTGTPQSDPILAGEQSIDGEDAVVKLDGGPIEPALQPIAEAEEVEVKGEYYPVVIRHHKKPD